MKINMLSITLKIISDLSSAYQAATEGHHQKSSMGNITVGTGAMLGTVGGSLKDIVECNFKDIMEDTMESTTVDGTSSIPAPVTTQTLLQK